LAIPDLDLIKQAEQGCMRFGKASPAISSGPSMTAINAGDLPLICCRSSRRISGVSMNGWSQSKTGSTTMRVCLSA
jgi:hypothetical protein